MPAKRITSTTSKMPHPATEIPAPVTALTRSAIHRRLPAAVCARLDEAILLRPKDLPTLEAIAAHFDLPRYRISLPALRAYARRLEDLARPAAAGQLVAVVLGCLPPSYRRRMRDGTETLLLSRVAEVLSLGNSQPLSVAELARLGPVLATMGRQTQTRKSAGAKRTDSPRPNQGSEIAQNSRLKGVVRDVFGLNLKDPSATPPARP